MQQVLFVIPGTGSLIENGLPVYGFGAMLFLCFVVTAMLWGPRRARHIGMPSGRLQDLAIILFVTGIAGARVVYMWQYSNQFEPGWTNLFIQFFQLQKGGIVVYGAVFGGLVGYTAFYYLVLRRMKISGWRLADVVAPLIAVGMAIGRIGCYLNGCCWGQPVCADCQIVPLAPELGQFPLLSAHSKEQVCLPANEKSRLPEIHGLQTSTGFRISPKPVTGEGDPRSRILAVEPMSQAEAAGLRAGDLITEVQGEPNWIIVELVGQESLRAEAIKRMKEMRGEVLPLRSEDATAGIVKVGFREAEDYRLGMIRLRDLQANGLTFYIADRLGELALTWPRGAGQLDLVVERAGKKLPISYTPRTVSFFPTQLYETVSMVLLILVLLAFQPLRRHNGQVMVLLMLGYSAHRFLNEALRIEPTYALDLTLSQWISLGIFAAGLLMECYLRVVQVPLPAGPQPLSTGGAPTGVAPA
jgi:phosphatidylglycerol---prolipoprotein diacylglyceryl transferase